MEITVAEGTVSRLVRERGFGFIKTDPGDEEVFFHASAAPQGTFDEMHEGQRVAFDKVRDPRGRGMRAENVRTLPA
jgi:CspA family cold shock protein